MEIHSAYMLRSIHLLVYLFIKFTVLNKAVSLCFAFCIETWPEVIMCLFILCPIIGPNKIHQSAKLLVRNKKKNCYAPSGCASRKTKSLFYFHAFSFALKQSPGEVWHEERRAIKYHICKTGSPRPALGWNINESLVICCYVSE